MSALVLLIPLALCILLFSIWGFFWCIKNNQYEDLESEGHKILFDEQDDLDESGKQDYGEKE